MRFIIREKQSLSGYRDGKEIKAAGLTFAKRYATASRAFQGTVLTIETGGGIDAMDTGVLVAYKRDGRWHDVS